MITLSIDNNTELIYTRNYETNKYEIVGLRSFNYEIDDIDNTCLIPIKNIDDLLISIQKLKQDLEEYNA